MREVTINSNDAMQRLDKFLTKYMRNIPQNMLYKGLRKNCVRVNGKHVKDGKYMLHDGDILSLYFKDEFFENKKQFINGSTDIDIIYENNNILLINKPRGLVVHSDDKGSGDTLLKRMQSYLYETGEYNPEAENSFSPALANRLDQNTSGIIIGVKNAPALRIINEKIRAREIRKLYMCVVEGYIKKDGTLSAFLTRGEKKVSVTDTETENSKKIITAYNVISAQKDKSLLEIELGTGRTHQIRAQMAHIGHPLWGDTKYGSVHKPPMMLTSYKLIFNFTSDAGILNYLRNREFHITADFSRTFSQEK